MEAMVLHRDKEREGRGYSLSELKEAKVSYQEARIKRILVDRRRKTKYNENVKALKSIFKK